MISTKIQTLFNFIDFLHSSKQQYIVHYLPIVKQVEILNYKRRELEPIDNYIKKEKYRAIQKEINDKFPIVIENIYQPITQKLLELKIWSGDETYSSIWNNNIEAISQFKNEFESADVAIVTDYKRKYLSFRTETRSNFLCLGAILSLLDETLKELFNFFKDSDENEFTNFEIAEIKVDTLEELVKSISGDKTMNLKYSLPLESLAGKQKQPYSSLAGLHFNTYETVMGDKITAENVPNNQGIINIGKDNNSLITPSDELAVKSYNWQKYGIISATILAIITILIAILFS